MSRYRNEAMVGAALLALIFAYLFKNVSKSHFDETRASVNRSVEEIEEAKALKSLWHVGNMKKRLEKLKAAVPASRLSTFKMQRRKVTMVLKDLKASELNRFMNRMASMPIRIKKLSIECKNDRFSLECLCKW